MAKEMTAQNSGAPQFLIDPSTPSNVVFAIKESLKTIRTNLVLSLPDEGCKKIVITSSLPNEGKTTTSVNISIALAMSDKKVLLVDTDLRKKRIGKVVKLHHYRGFTDVIRGDVEFDEIVNETKYPGLHILSAGSSVTNPPEIIASKATENFINSISDRYDYIIFDVPPINIVSDSLPIIKKCNGVILLAREMLTTHKEFKKALASLELIDANILGVVYIGSDSTEPYYRSSNNYGYGRYGRYGRYSKYGRYGKYGAYGKYGTYGYGEDSVNNKK